MVAGEARSLLTTLFQAFVQAVHPLRLVQHVVWINNETLVVQLKGEHTQQPAFSLNGRVFLIGVGKGAGPMAEALMSLLGDRIAGGSIIIPSEQTLRLPGITVMQGEHPLPGQGSLTGTQALVNSLAQVQPQDLVLFCLTGGASSLLVRPAPGMTLADKKHVNQVLLACGADIRAINTVRKHLSQIKGGWLAYYAQPAAVVSLILSDVIGDDLSVIGSGPTVPDPTTFADVWQVIEHYRIETQMPASVCSYLRQGLRGAVPDTPKPGDSIFARVHNILIGSNRVALRTAENTAEQSGLRSHILSHALAGDTTQVAREFAATLRSVLHSCSAPTCVLAGGETTVQVRGNGKGGRNQEFALVVAQELQGEKGWTLLSAGTDGIDGPTDAAGAFADGQTIAQARLKHLNPFGFLRNNDTYAFFSALGDLFRPGSTGTNVMDIKIALVSPPST